jgi:hypothetical protein
MLVVKPFCGVTVCYRTNLVVVTMEGLWVVVWEAEVERGQAGR